MGRVSEKQALTIARAAPGDSAKQQLGLKLALGGRDVDYIRARIERERARTEAATQLGMFGNKVFEDSNSDAEAQNVVDIRRDLAAKIKAGKNAAKDPETAKKMGIEVSDPAKTLQEVAAMEDLLRRWDGAWWAGAGMPAPRGDAGPGQGGFAANAAPGPGDGASPQAAAAGG